MNSYLQVTVPVENDQQKEMFVAELISIGFESFEEESNTLKAFVNTSGFNEKELGDFAQHHRITPGIEIIPEKNWNEEWEKNFEPVVIDEYCTVRAEFHKLNMGTRYEIVITPKMSFGTGHHATTYLMLVLMKEMQFLNQGVLDFGTGTGILAIMAEKLGAKDVLAVDIDEWSIENAAENLQMNNCTRVQVKQADNIPVNKSFKIVLANINKNVILDSLPVMCKALDEKGEILLSGLLESDFEQINDEATKLGLHLQKKGEKSGWIALRYTLHS